jgi:hypothetical protein
MSLHILLCDKMPLYFILCIGIIQSLNLNFESNRFEGIKGFIKEKVFLSPDLLLGRFPAVGPGGLAIFSCPWPTVAQLGPAATTTRPRILEPNQV